MTSDPFLDGASPLALFNIAHRTPLDRTVMAVVERLPAWDRPEALLELTKTQWDQLPEVMVRWWRRAAQSMTCEELSAYAEKIKRGEVETVEVSELGGEIAAGLEKARQRHAALTDEERRQESLQVWEDKAARTMERNARSREYQDLLQRLLAEEKSYMEVLGNDLASSHPDVVQER